MNDSEALVAAVRAGLAAAGDARKAPEMQRYMKSELPFRGVAAPERKALGRRLSGEHVLGSPAALRTAVLTLWRQAAYREERYVAIDLTGDRRYAAWQTPSWLPVYEEMIVTGAWWDFVDEVANRRVGALLRTYPA